MTMLMTFSTVLDLLATGVSVKGMLALAIGVPLAFYAYSKIHR